VADVVFNGLADFIDAATEDDKQFVVIPYHLSDYNSVEEFLLVINGVETLPEEVEDWLHYFPEAKPHNQGGDIYTAILIGFSMPSILSFFLQNICNFSSLLFLHVHFKKFICYM